MNHLSRRAFLGALAAGSSTAPMPAAKPEAKADTLIVLWMAGGMAQTETFDPKRYTAFESGLDSKGVLSTFPAIDTVVDNIKLSQGLEGIASIMDRCTLVRTYQAADLGFILHSRHQYHWHTGYTPPLSVAAPHLGAVVARTLGPKHADVPPFIDIGQNLDIGAESDALKAFHTAGFLGTEYGPFFVADPKEAAAAVQPPPHISTGRFQNRQQQYRKLMEANPVLREGSDHQQQSLLRSVENAFRLMNSPAAKAFDISLEPKESYAKYNTGRFGLGCLLARRLTEAGARFIEVTTEYIPFRHWDTHENGHERAVGMKQEIDQPIKQLVLDLEERGLLDRTLIVLASEFGRDMIFEGKPDKQVKDQIQQPVILQETKHYGMHRHFTEAGSVLLIGGGMKKGFLYGTTADERPCRVVDKPVRIEELHATIYQAMGIPPDLAYEVEKRPFHVTRREGETNPGVVCMNFTEYLGLRTVEKHEDGVTIECPLQSFYFNPDGSLHGGVIATIADEAVWFAIEHVLHGQRQATTVELKVNYLRAAANTQMMRARARLVKTGKTLCVGTVELADERGLLCSIATVTYMLL